MHLITNKTRSFLLSIFLKTLSKNRLNVIQTTFGQDIGFSMRTFWFNAQTSSSTGQDQTVECNLRLDPVASVSSSQPNDCTCYTQADCAAPGKIPIDHDHTI